MGSAIKIDFAMESDYEYISLRDKHIHKSLIRSKIKQNEILIISRW